MAAGAGRGRLGLRAGSRRVWNDPVRAYPGWDGNPALPPTQVRPSLSSPIAPQAAPGQAKPNGAPVKRAPKAKATQAGKLRNSAKGKVPKSALGKLRKGLDVLPPVVGVCGLEERVLEAGLKRSSGISRIPTGRHAPSGVLVTRSERNTSSQVS